MDRNQIDITIKAFNLAKKELDSLDKQLGGLGDTAKKKVNPAMAMMGKAVAGIGLLKLSKDAATFTYEATKLSAGVMTLGVVTQTLGKNAGYTGQQISNLERAIQKKGITTQASRQSIAKMMQAELDLADATDLARLAQDAAVIAGTNSSEAFSRLVDVISTGNVRMARTMGLQVDFNKGYKEMAVRLGKTSDELTTQEKSQSRANSVLAEGVQIAGTYEAAMESVGKQLESTVRYQEEYSVALGEKFVPTLGKLNLWWQKQLKITTDILVAENLLREAQEMGLITKMDVSDVMQAINYHAVEAADVIAEWTSTINEANSAIEKSNNLGEISLETKLKLTEAEIVGAEAIKKTAETLKDYSFKALAATEISNLLADAMRDGIVTSEEREAIREFADIWGVTLPEDYDKSLSAFNIMKQGQVDGIEALYQLAVKLTEKQWVMKFTQSTQSFAENIPVPTQTSLDEFGFAKGGTLPSRGPALVGEEGPELIFGRTVIPAGPTRRLLAGGVRPGQKLAGGGYLGGIDFVPDWASEGNPYNIPSLSKTPGGAFPSPSATYWNELYGSKGLSAPFSGGAGGSLPAGALPAAGSSYTPPPVSIAETAATTEATAASVGVKMAQTIVSELGKDADISNQLQGEMLAELRKIPKKADLVQAFKTALDQVAL